MNIFSPLNSAFSQDTYKKIHPEQIHSLIKQAKEDLVNKIVVGGVIKNENSKILIVKRAAKEDFLPGLLEFPSGHLEEDESILEGLVREIYEETSYKNFSIEKYINFFDYTSRSGKKVRQFNFLIKLEQEKEPILNEKEHQSYFWCDYEEALSLGADETVLNCLEIIFKKSIE